MDVARLTEVIRRSEAVTCEAANYRGLTLSTLMQSWPEEVMSGRVCGRVKTKTASSNVVKAYVQFVKAAAALAEAAASLGTPEVPIQFIRETPGTRPGSTSSRTATVPALSRLQLSPAETKTASSVQPFNSSSSMHTMSSVDFDASPSATSQLLGLRNSDSEVSTHIGRAPPMPCPMAVPGAFEPVTSFSHVEPGALVKYQEPQQQHQMPQQQGVVSVIPDDRGQRLLLAAQLLGVPTALLQRVASCHAAGAHGEGVWRRRILCLLGFLLTTLMPQLFIKLVRLVIEKTVTTAGHTAWRVGTAASSEASEASTRFIAFLEESLDVCLLEPPSDFTPVPATAAAVTAQAAALAAATAAAQAIAEQAGGGSVDLGAVSSAINRSVQAAVAAVQSQPTSTPVIDGGWKVPGWLLFVGGTIFSRFRFTVQE